MKKEDGKVFLEEKIENVKRAQIQNLMQVRMSLGQEHSANWSSLCDDNFDFDAKDRLIEALEAVTPEMVNAKFNQLFFENPKRVQIKLQSQNHMKNIEEIEKAKKENIDFYTSLGIPKVNAIDNFKIFQLSSQKYPMRKNI